MNYVVFNNEFLLENETVDSKKKTLYSIKLINNEETDETHTKTTKMAKYFFRIMLYTVFIWYPVTNDCIVIEKFRNSAFFSNKSLYRFKIGLIKKKNIYQSNLHVLKRHL